MVLFCAAFACSNMSTQRMDPRPDNWQEIVQRKPWLCLESANILYSFGDSARLSPEYVPESVEARSWILLDSTAAFDFYHATLVERRLDESESGDGLWEMIADTVHLWWHDLFTTSDYRFVIERDSAIGSASGTTDELVPDPAGGYMQYRWQRELRAHRVACDEL